jgi:signal transduction histidine kinase
MLSDRLSGQVEASADEIAFLRRRVAALEAELKALRPGGHTTDGEPGAQDGLEAANAELRRLADELEDRVRQRTHALAESEAELRRKNAELQRASRMKLEFIAIAAHELRTPMTTIVGYIDMIDKGRLGELPVPFRRPFAIIARNVRRLGRLVEELLDISRMDSGRLSIFRAPHDVRELLTDALAASELYTGERGQSLHLEVVGALPSVDIDGDKIHRSIVNLIVTVAKQAPDRATIDVAASANEGRLNVVIRADGAGIPSSLQRHVFEPFTDVVAAKHHSSSVLDSAGLGLYTAKGVLELHGGGVTLETQEGRYAEFRMWLPLGPR